MKQAYFLIALLGCASPMIAMESYYSNGKDTELKEIVVELPPMNVGDFMSSLKIKGPSFDMIRDHLSDMSKKNPKAYSILVTAAQKNNIDPVQCTLLTLIKYDHAKNVHLITRLIQETKSWRSLAIGGWAMTGVISLVLPIMALIIATAH